jgi:hypothetical protein
MKYMIEPIGAEFSSKAISALGDRFTKRSKAIRCVYRL